MPNIFRSFSALFFVFVLIMTHFKQMQINVVQKLVYQSSELYIHHIYEQTVSAVCKKYMEIYVVGVFCYISDLYLVDHSEVSSGPDVAC